MKTLTVDEWEDCYKPIFNPITDEHGWNGQLFETYGPELAHVQAIAKSDPDKIWTLVDDGEDQSIIPGYHWVNRMGYFICANPFYSHEIEVTCDD